MTTVEKQPDFISVYMPIAGWKAIHYHFNTEDIPGEGFWEPWDTGICAFMTKAEAVTDAKRWALDLGLEYRDTHPDNCEDAPTESPMEQLRKLLGKNVTIMELKK